MYAGWFRATIWGQMWAQRYPSFIFFSHLCYQQLSNTKNCRCCSNSPRLSSICYNSFGVSAEWHIFSVWNGSILVLLSFPVSLPPLEVMISQFNEDGFVKNTKKNTKQTPALICHQGCNLKCTAHCSSSPKGIVLSCLTYILPGIVCFAHIISWERDPVFPSYAFSHLGNAQCNSIWLLAAHWSYQGHNVLNRNAWTADGEDEESIYSCILWLESMQLE